MLKVALSDLIIREREPGSLIHCLLGSSPYKVYSYKTGTAEFSLTKQEEKKIISLTLKIAEHLVMIKWSNDDTAISKNKSDLVNAFIRPIYKTCLKERVNINSAIYWSDDEKFLKSIKRRLKEGHNYKGKFDDNKLLNMISDLMYLLNKERLSNTPWSAELGYRLLEDILE